jgi:AhpD family alkylhydroperoxidase
MEKRVNVEKTEPQAYKAMYALEGYLGTTLLTPSQKDLVKIRASQINGCAFCIDLHTKDALKNGETNQRIFLLNAWRESDLFTSDEKVILAMTEEITLIHNHGLSEETYKEAEQTFSENHIAQIIMAIATINTWNRIAISTNMQPKRVTREESIL